MAVEQLCCEERLLEGEVLELVLGVAWLCPLLKRDPSPHTNQHRVLRGSITEDERYPQESSGMLDSGVFSSLKSTM